MAIGCRLGMSRINIIVYADDMVLLADNKDTLEQLYKKFYDLVTELKLVINSSKSKVMKFCKKLCNPDMTHIYLNNENFDIVRNFKYLGNILNYNLDDVLDVQSKLNSFYSSFNAMYRSFNGVNIEILIHLFNSYCVPQYGLQLWTSHNIFHKQYFKCFEIAFNNALKQIVGCPRYASSHITAEICHMLLLKHGVCVTQARYFH